jgi:hypothetical protein
MPAGHLSLFIVVVEIGRQALLGNR